MKSDDKVNVLRNMITILMYLFDPMQDWQMMGKSVRLFFLPTAIPEPGFAYLERLIFFFFLYFNTEIIFDFEFIFDLFLNLLF